MNSLNRSVFLTTAKQQTLPNKNTFLWHWPDYSYIATFSAVHLCLCVCALSAHLVREWSSSASSSSSFRLSQHLVNCCKWRAFRALTITLCYRNSIFPSYEKDSTLFSIFSFLLHPPYHSFHITNFSSSNCISIISTVSCSLPPF